MLTQRQTPALATALVRIHQPHLAVYAGEAIGVVGPLVQPGSTACLSCLDLTRAAKDPAWPLILAQLPEHAADLPACDPVLAASVAAQAAGQVLAFADRAPRGGRQSAPRWNWSFRRGSGAAGAGRRIRPASAGVMRRVSCPAPGAARARHGSRRRGAERC